MEMKFVRSNTAATIYKHIEEPEFVIARTFNAPRNRVWEAWTDSVKVKRWWGPVGFAVPVCEMDARPGGKFRIVMRSPYGVEYPLKGVYRKVVEPEQLIYTENWDEHPAQWQQILRDNGAGNEAQGALNTISFDEVGEGKTKVTIRTLFEAGSIRDAMEKMGMKEGWMESLNRLADLLAKE
jgi:uncharacterized protein YndB with AHSA1/START domain